MVIMDYLEEREIYLVLFSTLGTFMIRLLKVHILKDIELSLLRT
jgi:hypothetical protein